MLFSNIEIQMKEDMLSNKSRGPLHLTTTTTSSLPLRDLCSAFCSTNQYFCTPIYVLTHMYLQRFFLINESSLQVSLQPVVSI